MATFLKEYANWSGVPDNMDKELQNAQMDGHPPLPDTSSLSDKDRLEKLSAAVESVKKEAIEMMGEDEARTYLTTGVTKERMKLLQKNYYGGK